MEHRFRCAVCRKNLSCDDEQAGQLVHCADCGVTLVAPDSLHNQQSAHVPDALEAPIHLRAGWDQEYDEMDMTPMVDVTFLLLIFFMVTASYALQKSFQLPRSDNQQSSRQVQTIRDLEENPDYIVVRVDQYSTFFVSAAAMRGDQEREVTDRQSLIVELRNVLTESIDGQSPTRLVVVAHGDARHEQVIVAMDVGSEVGLQDVLLVTTEDDEA